MHVSYILLLFAFIYALLCFIHDCDLKMLHSLQALYWIIYSIGCTLINTDSKESGRLKVRYLIRQSARAFNFITGQYQSMQEPPATSLSLYEIGIYCLGSKKKNSFIFSMNKQDEMGICIIYSKVMPQESELLAAEKIATFAGLNMHK